jgi:ABC-type sulfate/molybdate transport systems ATPase subunit
LHVEAVADLGDLHLEVDLDVPSGRCLAIAGPSGAGKSSSLRIAAGLLRPTSGRVTCGDVVWLDTAHAIDRHPEQRRCGYVFQDYALFPHQRAWQNVAYALRDRPRATRRREAVNANASRLPARSRAGPMCCCSTSRCPRSTRARAQSDSASWQTSCASPRFRPSS